MQRAHVRLAAQHGLHLLSCRHQLIGLARGQPLAGMGLDVADEIGQFAAGGGRLPCLDRRQHILQLVVQGVLQAAGEVVAVDQADQVIDLGGCAFDHHLEAARGHIGRTGRVAGAAVDRGGANREGAARGG